MTTRGAITALRRSSYLTALSLGPEALTLQRTLATGHILAVLSNAVYLASDSGRVVGIANRDAADGPLTLRVAHLAPAQRALNGREGAPFHATTESLGIDGSVSIRWGRARRWTSQLPSSLGTPEAQKQAAHALAHEIAKRRQTEGLGALLSYMPGQPDAAQTALPPLGTVLLQRTARSLDQFSQAMREGHADEAARALIPLLGLGPGLTPSGDDLVAGILATLVWRAGVGSASRVTPMSELADTVCGQAPLRTNLISARLLWHAGRGVLYAPAMEMGAALLAGDPEAIRVPARRLFSIGATSGIDLAVGLLFAACLDT